MLAELHSDRVAADYKLAEQRYEKMKVAQDCVESALEVQRLLLQFKSACDSDPTVRASLADGIARIKAIHRI